MISCNLVELLVFSELLEKMCSWTYNCTLIIYNLWSTTCCWQWHVNTGNVNGIVYVGITSVLDTRHIFKLKCQCHIAYNSGLIIVHEMGLMLEDCFWFSCWYFNTMCFVVYQIRRHNKLIKMLGTILPLAKSRSFN